MAQEEVGAKVLGEHQRLGQAISFTHKSQIFLVKGLTVCYF